MTTIPDDHQPDYDNGPALAALRAEFPAPWQIGYEPLLHVFSAELRSADGRYSLHYLAGQTVDELRERLVTATTVAP